MTENIFANPWVYLAGGVVAVLGLVLFLRRGKRSQPIALKPMLEELGAEYAVFTDVVVAAQNGMSHIDFVVVSPYGVFVIDARRERGKIVGNVGDREWGLGGNRTIYNPVWRNRTHVNGLEKFLGSLPYVSLVVFVNARLKSDFGGNVVELPRMIPFIERHRRQAVPAERVRQAVRALEQKQAGT
ncbi:MAG: nuclease-related domain-containing protein [Nitrospinales bacterium]